MAKSGPAYKRVGKNIYEVRVATTANILLDGTVTAVDGVTLAANDLVLVRAQTVGAQNGLYRRPAAGAWTRATDLLTALGTTARVREGTANRGKLYTADDTSGTVWR